MKKILFYSHSYTSLGPVIRSEEACKALCEGFEVEALLGHESKIVSPHFHANVLPKFGTADRRTQSGPTSTQEMVERKKKIDQIILGKHYDIFLTELFPFSKTYLLPEILYIYSQIKQPCRLISLMRDAADLTALHFEKTIEEIVKQYERILVLADPKILRLEDSFPLAEKFPEKIFYTGFMPHRTASDISVKRKKQVLVSMGTGGYGEELARAVFQIIDFFPEYEFIFNIGPHASPELKNALPHWVPFIQDFETALRESALTISTGGSSLVDLVYTKTPGLGLATEMTDQSFRVKAFAAKGLIRELRQEDLEKEKLRKVVADTLTWTPAPFPVEMNGAEKVLEYLSFQPKNG